MDENGRNPDAIIFIPGIGSPWEGDLVEGFADRLVAALERKPDGYHGLEPQIMRTPQLESYGANKMVKVVGSDRSAGPSKDLIYVYALDLPALLVQRYANTGTFKKAFELMLHMIGLTNKVFFG